jgi:alpha-tubulin suppressor-like RCC1 family protein
MTSTHQSLLIIRSYMFKIFGPHYPKEIIWLIITFYNELIIPQIFCGKDFIFTLEHNELYVGGSKFPRQSRFGKGDKVLNQGVFTKINIPTTRCNFVASTVDSLNPQRISDPNVLTVSCGEHHTIVLTKDNKLYTCGNNQYGQLGLGDRNNRNTFTKVNVSNTRCEQSLYPWRIFGPNVVSVTCGGYHTMILTKNGELYACGDNQYGQLGLGKEDKVLSAGNIFDILGKGNILNILGDINKRSVFTKVKVPNVNCEQNLHSRQIFGPNVISVTCGGYHTMILTNNGELYACGNNQYGQLGLGKEDKVLSNYEMGAKLPSTADLRSTGNNNRNTFTKVEISNVLSVTCGDYHTMILTKNNELYACGNNSFGQLGLGKGNKVSSIGSIYDTLDDTLTQNIFVRVGILNISKVYCGSGCTMMITKNNELHSYGNNNYEKYNVNDNTDQIAFTKVDILNVASVYCGGHHTMILTNNHELYACGDNQYGQLGLGKEDKVLFTGNIFDILGKGNSKPLNL